MKAILCVTIVCVMFTCGLSMLVAPDAGSISRTAGTESAVVGGDKVKGLGATWLLVQQADRRESVIAEMRRFKFATTSTASCASCPPVPMNSMS